MKFNHAMLDIETLGTGVNSVVFQVGLTFLQPNVQTLGLESSRTDTVGWYIAIEEQLDMGRKIDVPTLFWWTIEHADLWKEHVTRMQNVCSTVMMFIEQLKNAWEEHTHSDTLLWAEGPQFDVSNIASLIGEKNLPWRYNQVRDFRTVHKHVKTPSAIKRSENLKPHDALYDSLAQAHTLQEYLAHVR